MMARALWIEACGLGIDRRAFRRRRRTGTSVIAPPFCFGIGARKYKDTSASFRVVADAAETGLRQYIRPDIELGIAIEAFQAVAPEPEARSGPLPAGEEEVCADWFTRRNGDRGRRNPFERAGAVENHRAEPGRVGARPMIGTLPSCQSPAKNVQVREGAAVIRFGHAVCRGSCPLSPADTRSSRGDAFARRTSIPVAVTRRSNRQSVRERRASVKSFRACEERQRDPVHAESHATGVRQVAGVRSQPPFGAEMIRVAMKLMHAVGCCSERTGISTRISTLLDLTVGQDFGHPSKNGSLAGSGAGRSGQRLGSSFCPSIH